MIGRLETLSARPVGARGSSGETQTYAPKEHTPPREPGREGNRPTVEDIRARIAALCAEQPRTCAELADIIGATKKVLVRNTVQSLRAMGRLVRTDGETGGPAQYGPPARHRAEEGPDAPPDAPPDAEAESEPDLEEVFGQLEQTLHQGPALRVEQIPRKRAVLRRLALLLDPTIAEVLEAIDADYAELERWR